MVCASYPMAIAPGNAGIQLSERSILASTILAPLKEEKKNNQITLFVIKSHK